MIRSIYRLYQYPLCPRCRVVRLALYEKQIEHNLIFENPLDRRMEFLKLNPLGYVPIIITPSEKILSGYDSILNYLNEGHSSGLDLFGQDPIFRAEVRRILSWIFDIMNREIEMTLISGKIVGFHQNEPDAKLLRIGRKNLKRHLDYATWLINRRHYLAGDRFSVADLALASFLSVLDYLGEIEWEQYPDVKNWYAPIKSRPSFSYLLKDRVAGIIPPEHYIDLDF